MFTLCIENGSDQRYLIGFQVPGIAKAPAHMDQLFNGEFEIEDTDIILADQPKTADQTGVLHHRCQLVSFVHQPETTEVQWVKFLEKKKLKVAPDDDLRLIIHVEQQGRLNYAFLHLFLQHRQPKCPYSQVFVFGQVGEQPRKWQCVQIYPDLAILPELDEETAKALVVDRKRFGRAPGPNASP
jgi:hypothetical protein